MKNGCATNMEGRCRVAFYRLWHLNSLKLFALIDQMLSGVVDTLAGTGRRIQRHYSRIDLMSQREEDGQVTVDTADGWVFAYEGGAHILFRHTTKDQRFVRNSLHLSSVEAVQC